ncbi:MAG: hypothetical protein JRN20_14265 [Nitrososphaerota archaeon]|nr:hypothetical protein [Nitrososphaerota archaeon]
MTLLILDTVVTAVAAILAILDYADPGDRNSNIVELSQRRKLNYRHSGCFFYFEH